VHTTTAWLSFLRFWGVNIWIIYRGMELLRHVGLGAPFVLVMTGARVVGDRRAEGLGRSLAPRKIPDVRRVWPVFVPSLTR